MQHYPVFHTVESSRPYPGDNTGTRIIVLISVLAALFSLDVLTTDIILTGGGIEYNPFMAAIVASPFLHLLIKGAVLALVFLAARYSEETLRGSGPILCMTIIGWYLICIGHNFGSILHAAALG